eukprot:COSAG01_NODE_1283_length_10920_cov_5.539507_11_plen_66_part_00
MQGGARVALPLRGHGHYRLARDGLLEENNGYAGSNVPKYKRAQEEIELAAVLELAPAEAMAVARL